MDASARTYAATEQTIKLGIQRAVDDPARLERAACIVRAALARRKLTLDDLTRDAPPVAERTGRLKRARQDDA